jgi:tRNA(fMet)-specific endonuclease VapC
MSFYILDTDTVSLFQHGHAAVCAAVAAHAPTDVGISVITVEEQLSGWYTELRRAKTDAKLAIVYQRMADTVRFYASMPIISFSEAAIGRCKELVRQKLGVRKSDLRIAAIALQTHATVVTRNIRDFRRVAGLTIDDWAK